ncbi:MAG: ATP-binding protein [Rickettsiales bacterium]|nr:ATP-binding protein [Rickettsiales bacterium]
MKSNQLILLYGMPSSGKLTMAKRLQSEGALLMDNHYFRDFVRPFVELGPEDWDTYTRGVAKIRSDFFEILGQLYPKTNHTRYLLTNALFEQDGEILQQFIKLASDIKAEFIPIELLAKPEVLKSRCQTKAREDRGKIASPEIMDNVLKTNKLIDIQHPNKLSIDVSDLDEAQTYDKIKNHLAKFD